MVSAAFTVSNTSPTTSCNFPTTYTSSKPSWVSYSTNKFTIESLTTTTLVSLTEPITMTATPTYSATYVGPRLTVTKTITATLLACSVDSVSAGTTGTKNIAYTLKHSSITPATVSSAAITVTQTPACGYPITVTKTDSVGGSSATTISGTYKLDVSTSSYSDEGIHNILFAANVDSSKRSASYTSTPLNLQVTVTFCIPNYSVATKPEDKILIPFQASSTTTYSISVLDANSCGFESLLINN